MATSLIPLDSASKLPAHLQAFATEGNEFGFSGGTFPTISIKGKVFTISKGKEKTLVTKPGSEDGEPAASLEVVVLGVGPKNGYAKTFYAEGFVEGSSAKPDCSSNDGISPLANSGNKQASKCALCPQNAVGSGATNQNPKAKACKSSKVLAVAPAGQLNDPMMLRVPGGSTIQLSEYGDFLAKRGVKAAGVVTRIGFDYSVAHPALTFKALGGITAEMAQEILPMLGSKLVKQIVGETVHGSDDEETPAAPAIVAPQQTKPAPAPSAFAAPAEGAPEATAKPAGKKAAKAATVVSPVTDPGVASALDALDFDDK